MHIERLVVKNFRGIRQMSWRPPHGLVCLIGPGDSTKTTVLDALALLFSPTSSVSLDDSDFYECKSEEGLKIEAVVTSLPTELASMEAFGDLHCGWADNGELKTDPDDGTTRALVLRFSADDSLEPIWEVVKPDSDERRDLRAGTRSRLGIFRVEDRVDYHLRWARGSSLLRLTGDTEAVNKVLTSAQRTARKAVFDTELPELSEAAARVAAEATSLGGAVFGTLRPGLHPGTLASGPALTLHDGEVPLSRHGLGVRRITSVAIQRLQADQRTVLLIDEIEHGLEPHRLLRILRTLQTEVAEGMQVFLTTHSPIVVEALAATLLGVVSSKGGETTIRMVPESIEGLGANEPHGTIRSGSAAMLSKRVLVVEGRTEEGLLRGLCRHWDSDDRNLASLGVSVRNGDSDLQALQRSQCLAELGFEAGAFLDSDSPLAAEEKATSDAGVTVIRAASGLCLEQHIARDLPENLLKGFLQVAVDLRADTVGDEVALSATRDEILSRLDDKTPLAGDDPAAWVTDSRSITNVRDAIGLAASKKSWFKHQPHGEKLAEYLISEFAAIEAAADGDDHFWRVLTRLKTFLYGATDNRDLGDEAE